MVNEPWLSMNQIIKSECVPLVFVSAANLTKSARAPFKLDSRDLRPSVNCLIWLAKILSENCIVPILFLQHEFCFLITSFAAINCSLIEFKNIPVRSLRTRKSPNVFGELDPFQLAAGIFACHILWVFPLSFLVALLYRSLSIAFPPVLFLIFHGVRYIFSPILRFYPSILTLWYS